MFYIQHKQLLLGQEAYFIWIAENPFLKSKAGPTEKQKKKILCEETAFPVV